MAETWYKVDYEVSNKLAGYVMLFHDDEENRLKLSENARMEIEKVAGDAKVFIQVSDQGKYNFYNMLTWYIKSGGETFEQYITKELKARNFKGDPLKFIDSFTINFTPNSVQVDTEAGPKDLRSLTSVFEFSVMPKGPLQ